MASKSSQAYEVAVEANHVTAHEEAAHLIVRVAVQKRALAAWSGTGIGRSCRVIRGACRVLAAIGMVGITRSKRPQRPISVQPLLRLQKPMNSLD